VNWAYVHSDRVRFGDLDPMGHVNNVDFLRFFESARIAFHRGILGEHGFIGGTEPPKGVEIVVAEVHANYRAPAYFDEELRTAVRPVDIERSSYRVEFETRANDRVVADGHAVLVGYDHGRNESVPLPDDVRERLLEAASRPKPGGGAWA
jgi:acyl-CoA thioester hydrolase